MAISEDTVALVAAQLTAAWAMRAGVRKPTPDLSNEEQIAMVYGTFKALVSSVD